MAVIARSLADTEAPGGKPAHATGSRVDVPAGSARTAARQPVTAVSTPELPAFWFVVLPDTPRGALASQRLLSAAQRVLSHASGRPWVVGCWPEHQSVTASSGESRIVLIGESFIGAAELERYLERTTDVGGLDTLASTIPGSFHLIARIAHRDRIQGSATGMRKIFSVVVDDQVIAADRADVLAAVAGLDLDPTAIALAMLDPVAPYPLQDRPMWRGVDLLPPDRFLLLDEYARRSTIRWWTRPFPELPMAQGAQILRRALSEAVAVRTSLPATVGCDLSGGLDSTSICFLAARGSARLVAFTGQAMDPGDDDLAWASDAAQHLTGITREILPRGTLPLAYDEIISSDEQLDRPFMGFVDRAKLQAALRLVRKHGATIHLTGLGGDEVVEGSVNYLCALLFAHPRRAVARFRGHRIQERWPARSWAELVRPRSHRGCLAALADRLIRTPADPTGGQMRSVRPRLGRAAEILRPAELLRGWMTSPDGSALDWAGAARLPDWASPYAAELVRTALDEILETVQPLGDTRDQHADLESVRAGADIARSFAQLAEHTGVQLAAPFFDDRVVEASLAVRAEDRTSPWEYKPLLKDAMRGIVPAANLRRITKADVSYDEALGLSRNRADLLDLCEDSRLAELDLVDAEALRTNCRFTPDPSLPHEALQQTFACEVWLRVLAQDPAALLPTADVEGRPSTRTPTA